LNFNSKALRKEMYEGKNSIVRKWLSPKFGMAGWRVDVGNMTGRLGKDDLHDEVITQANGWRKANGMEHAVNAADQVSHLQNLLICQSFSWLLQLGCHFS